MESENAFEHIEFDEFGTKDYKIYIKSINSPFIISPFHDIPLWIEKNNIANMIVEIPKGSRAKLEISKKELYNPIMHDIKNDKIRFVGMDFPYIYGALPQTWENPNYIDPNTESKGDNDPLDILDI